jgi:lipoprotein-anchoring transpeptidase ErfK/SrfK
VQKGWVTIGGKEYYASYNTGAAPMKYGALLTGYRKIGAYYYYLNPANGAMATGLVKIGNKYYYFTPGTGRQVRTANANVTANGNIYKVLADMSLQYVRKAPSTAAAGGKDAYGMDAKAQKYSSSTRYLILVNKGKHNINIYQGSKGKWTCIRRNIRCTIGKKSTPSPSGSWTLNHKTNKKHGYKDFSASTAFYATRISAGNYFHSILYRKGSRNPATAKVKDGSLGKSKSNSCIRLPLADAKFIYQVTPTKTRVIVY